jgi:hypothetical protein
MLQFSLLICFYWDASLLLSSSTLYQPRSFIHLKSRLLFQIANLPEIDQLIKTTIRQHVKVGSFLFIFFTM